MTDPSDGWTTVAKASEVPPGTLKRRDYLGKEVAIANVGGTFYAVRDRCGHMNAPLSRGLVRQVEGRPIVTCPLHSSTFDASTGRNLTPPVKAPPIDTTGTPKPVLDALAKAAELSAAIRVLDVEAFDVQQVGDEVRLRERPSASAGDGRRP